MLITTLKNVKNHLVLLKLIKILRLTRKHWSKQINGQNNMQHLMLFLIKWFPKFMISEIWLELIWLLQSEIRNIVVAVMPYLLFRQSNKD